jgi:hypothetical protein
MKENSGINMNKIKKEMDIEKLPTLYDVLLVEETLQDSNESIVQKSKLRQQLHGKIRQTTLTAILDYLDSENMIVESRKGITWIHNKQTMLAYADKLLEQSKLMEEDALQLRKEINKKFKQPQIKGS